MNDPPQTWHYGLVARYWAEHNTNGPEIAYFQSQIERYGQPALDAGCGAGRLLIPFLRAGLDVDGCDVSPDMLSLCRGKAEHEDLRPRLYQQALHELDLRRTYQTIIVCGVFGIGVSRGQDAVALERFHEHLEPGGVLLLDSSTDGEAEEARHKAAKNQFPEPWPDAIGKEPSGLGRSNRWVSSNHFEGTEYDLYDRTVAFDPVERRLTRQIRALLWREGQCMAEEEYLLYENLYSRNELHQMLGEAGFEIGAIQGDYTEAQATAEHNVIVFIARKQ